MKYSIDRIENNIAILEDINTGEKKEVDISLLPEEIKEGTILSFNDDKYELDLDEEEERRKRIREKFKKLRSNK